MLVLAEGQNVVGLKATAASAHIHFPSSPAAYTKFVAKWTPRHYFVFHTMQEGFAAFADGFAAMFGGGGKEKKKRKKTDVAIASGASAHGKSPAAL